MKHYKYVEICYKAKGVLFHISSDHKSIIDEHSREGYRYVGYVPSQIDAHGSLRKIDLIFEKNI